MSKELLQDNETELEKFKRLLDSRDSETPWKAAYYMCAQRDYIKALEDELTKLKGGEDVASN